MNELITVFTPSYNRKHLLPVLYNSLCKQTDKNFVWMIIDDGSSDGTQELVKSWQEENNVKIEYVYKKNGGMHTAHNTAYRLIKTELNVCVDSDDSMPEDAIEKITEFWGSFDRKNEVAGILALDFDINKKEIIGGKLPSDKTITTSEKLIKKYGDYGDKKFIYRTEIINSVNEYPEYENERLVPLSYKYWLVDRKMPVVTLNEVVCLVDYQPNGSTNTIKKQYFQSPKGFLAAKRELMVYPRIPKNQIKSAIHYIFFSKLSGEKHYIKKSPKKLLTVLLLPLGIMYYKKTNVKKD